MSKLKEAVNSNDHHLGNGNAVLTLVEYGDFECSHCRHAHGLLKRLLKERGEALQFIFRNFPLQEIHPHANMAAVAAEAAGKQNKFWEMHDPIFENQLSLDASFLQSLAQRIGLDPRQFSFDLLSDEIQKKIDIDFESGLRSGVNGTPTFFLNGRKISTYDESYASIQDAIDLELKKIQPAQVNHEKALKGKV